MGLYDRQETLDLKTDKTICIVGCGGIGYWVAKLAAMSGMEEIYLFDPDTIDESNLNRLDLPINVIGRNKAEITKIAVNMIRSNCMVYSFPFKLKNHTFPRTDWLIDCTDKFKSQEDNYKIAKEYGSKYVKAGYNGENFSIHNKIAEWGDTDDGYTITPSWVVPAIMVASFTVAKIMKYYDSEIATNIPLLFKEV